jgi:uncharacterized protein YbjT (DUF2867 family)
MDVLVVGGTGGLGRLVVDEFAARGHQVRVLSRRASPPTAAEPRIERFRGDLLTGDGLAAALDGVQAVVNTVNATRGSERVMVDGGRRLMEAAARAKVGHVVGIGIVGADLIAPWVPYYRVKVAEEAVLREGDVPWSLLRATQFHELVAAMIGGLARLPVLPAPAIRVQPVDRGEVATALVAAVEAGPSGRLPDFAGPQALPLADFAQMWLRAQSRHRRTVSLPIPSRVGRLLREGALCNPDQALARVTFEQWAARSRRQRV